MCVCPSYNTLHRPLTMSSSKTMKIFQAVRSVSILSSVAGIVLFAVALNIQTLALQGKQSNLAWGYLPLVGVSASAFDGLIRTILIAHSLDTPFSGTSSPLPASALAANTTSPAVSTSWPTSPLPLLSWLWDISRSCTTPSPSTQRSKRHPKCGGWRLRG